jgi:NMD protein affecting ribosome stability and mRNA decay
MRFCEENPNSETEEIKEYLCSLTGARYAKKRSAPEEKEEGDILTFIRETSDNLESETKASTAMEISTTEPDIQILKEKIVSKSEPFSQELIAPKPDPPPFTEFEEHMMKKLQLSSEFSICFNMGVKTSSSICTRCGESFERQNYYTNICSGCDRRKMRKLQVSETIST